MTDEYVTRTEFNQHNSSVDAKIATLEARITSDSSKLRDDIDRKLDRQGDKIDKLGESIQSLRNEVYNNRNATLKFAVSVLVSFILGGGGLELVRLIVTRTP